VYIIVYSDAAGEFVAYVVVRFDRRYLFASTGRHSSHCFSLH